jgi:hypothetical protein
MLKSNKRKRNEEEIPIKKDLNELKRNKSESVLVHIYNNGKEKETYKVDIWKNPKCNIENKENQN